MLNLLLSTALYGFVFLCSSAQATDSPKPQASAALKQDQASKLDTTSVDTNTNQPPSNDAADNGDPNDPLEPFNRTIHFFNSGVDAFVMKPLAIAYRIVLPEPVRDSVGNFFQNLRSPISVVNHMLQGEPQRAGNSLSRFVINTTLGFVGFFDTANHMGFKPFDTTFNETLGVWGVNNGPYLVLPLLGPSSFRHGTGMAVDVFFRPETYYFMSDSHENERWINYTLTGVELVHIRNTLLESLDDIANNAADPYATLRSVFFQRQDYRLKELKGDKNEAKETQEMTDSPKPS